MMKLQGSNKKDSFIKKEFLQKDGVLPTPVTNTLPKEKKNIYISYKDEIN